MTLVNTNTAAAGATNIDVGSETIAGKDVQRVKLMLGAPGADDGDASLSTPLPIKHASTGFVFSTVNSTTTQLGSGATFPGAVEAVIDQPAYSILLTSDQPGTLTVFQYIDAAGTQLAGSVPYAIAAGVGFARSGTMNGNYLKVTFQNTGPSATTTLRLDTAFGNILPATQANNMPMALQEVAAGVAVPVTAASLPLPTGAATSANQTSTNTKLDTIHNDLIAPLPAGTNLLGKVGIDQTTPGTTNAVALQPPLSVSTTQATSANGVLNYDLLSGSVSGWYDVSAYHGRYVSLLIAAGAGIAGGAMAYEQTDDTTLDSAGIVWNLQDKAVVTQSLTTTQTPAASTNYRRVGQITSKFIRIRLTSALTAGTLDVRLTISHVPFTNLTQGVVQATGSSLNTQVTGPAAQGATASGNPLLTGAVAKTAQPTARTDGQIVAPLYGKVGHGVQRLGHTRDLTTDAAQVVLTTTTETTIQAAVAATFNDLAAVWVTSNATYTGSPTGVRVDFRDTTAGAIRFSVNLPTAGGAFNQDLSRLGNEFKQATVNTNWTAQVAFVGGTTPAIGSGDIRITPKVVGNI